eukprot:g44348.t1
MKLGGPLGIRNNNGKHCQPSKVLLSNSWWQVLNLGELSHRLVKQQPDTIIFTESYLTDNILDATIIIPGYVLPHNQDRSSKGGDTVRGVDSRPQRGLDSWPQREFDSRLQRGLDSRLQRGLDSWPQRGLDSRPQRGLDSWPQRGLDSWLQRGLDSWLQRGLDSWPQVE